MLVTLSQFTKLGKDANGNVMPLAVDRISCEARTSVGAFSALNAATRYVRLATDSSIQMDMAGGATTSADELFPAGSVEFLAVNGGEVFTFAAA